MGVVLLWSTSLKAQNDIDSTMLLGKSRLYMIPTFSVSNRDAINDQQLLRLVHDQYRLEWEVDMNVGYFVKDNFAVGAQLSYSQNQEDITYTADNKRVTERSFGQSMTFSPNIRNYYGPGRLKVFNQTGLIFKVGEDLTRIYNETDEDKIKSNFYEFGIGIQPGIAFFFDRLASVEASINLLGWTTKIEESLKNDVEKSRVVTNDVSFSINVLTLKIGVGIYLNELSRK
jgi:hypothetical protein